MSDQRSGGIAWTDETWNPIRGCSRVSEGCRNCFAERYAWRFSGPGRPYEGLTHRIGGETRWTGKVVLVPERLSDPLRWRRFGAVPNYVEPFAGSLAVLLARPHAPGTEAGLS